MRPIRSGAVDRCLWSAGEPMAPAAEPPPERVDVAVVGAGYTGLSAARTLARRGARVAVLERERIGAGASGRNGGFVLPGFQVGLADLADRAGDTRAAELFQWSLDAIRALEAVIEDDAIACDYVRCGSLNLAARAGHRRMLETEAECLDRLAGYRTVLLEQDALADEIGSSRYHGGLLDPSAGALHPWRYVRGLAAAARRAGASLHEDTEVTALERGAGGHFARTTRGSVRAAEVLVATEGYTGAAFGWIRRRVVPVGSYIVATAPLAADLAARLVPRARVLFDSRRLLHYFRLSPDGRMVFGGRVAMTSLGTERAARVLGKAMRTVFPALAAAPVDFAWSGRVGFTRDLLPHAGRVGGVHYALGYGGHGVALATWLGGRTGDAIAGGAPIPELGPAPPVPLYGGRPWFLPLVDAYYRLRDRIG
jgi:glycine/D-amino acid oxidase-like deaminating enzyme